MPQDNDTFQLPVLPDQHDPPLKISRTATEQQQDQLNDVDRVKNLQQQTDYVQGDRWYLVPTDWILRWQEQHNATDTTNEAPSSSSLDTTTTLDGVIDMRPLLDNEGELVPNLQVSKDVELLPSAAWELLSKKYTFQPTAITRSVAENGVQPLLYPQYTIHILQHESNKQQQQPSSSALVSISPNSTLGDLLRAIKNTTHLDHLSFSLWTVDEQAKMTDNDDEKSITRQAQIDLSKPKQTIAEMDSHNTRVFAIQLEEAPGGVEEEMASTPNNDDNVDHHHPPPQVNEQLDWIATDMDISQPSKTDQSTETTDANATKSDDEEATSLSNLYNLDDTNVTKKTEDAMVDEEEEEKQPQYEKGYCGLSNMGNTCYMNSAIQCLSNTQELTRYFLEGRYNGELNRDNPLGMQGDLAEAYGALIRELWSGYHSHLTPRKFKYIISRYNSTFIGFRQHDSQELLSFLLDGLHEDLNRIKQKPYVEMPDFDDMPDTDIAVRCWDYHKARNDSVIVDIFQGQFKSRLECNECGKISIMFDPFMYLSLPLPVSKLTHLKIVYVPYDPSERQKKMTITFENAASIEDLKKQVAKRCNVDDPSKLLVVEIYDHGIFKMFPHYEPISNILPQDSIYVYELPCTMPTSTRHSASSSRKSKLRKLEGGSSPVEPTEYQDEDTWVVLPVYCSIAAEGREYLEQFGGPVIVAIPPEDVRDADAIYGHVVRHIERFAAIKLLEEIKDDKMMDLSPAGGSAMDVDGEEMEQPKMIHTPAAVTAAGGRRMGPMKNLFAMKMFSDIQDPESPIPLTVATSMSRDAVEDLEERAGRKVSTTQPQQQPLEAHSNDEEIVSQQPTDAVDTTNDQASNTSNSSSSNKSSHTTTTTNFDRRIIPHQPLIKQGEAMMAVWQRRKSEQVFTTTFGGSSPRINTTGWDDMAEDSGDEDHEHRGGRGAAAEQHDLSLGKCLQEFSKEEVLGDNDLWYCPRCKKHQHARKKIDLWHMPDILVIHLKRFSNTRALRDKIDVMVDFPVEGLDLTDMVASKAADRERLKSINNTDHLEEDSRVIYDLYAVDNHYGGMGGGHYTAFAQNPATKEWLKFNDSHVSPVHDVENVKTNAAYLLFYKRRGIAQPDAHVQVSDVAEKNQ